MATDFFSGRVQLLHDTEENWQSVADTFIPLPGEACVTLDDENKGRVKIGDGIHTWGELPYTNDHCYDDKSIISREHTIQLVNYEAAELNTVPRKTENGLEWFTPVNTVYLGDEPLEPSADGVLFIPIADENALGLVKASDEIGIGKDGSLTIKKIDASKLDIDGSTFQEELDERTQWKEFGS